MSQEAYFYGAPSKAPVALAAVGTGGWSEDLPERVPERKPAAALAPAPPRTSWAAVAATVPDVQPLHAQSAEEAAADAAVKSAVAVAEAVAAVAAANANASDVPDTRALCTFFAAGKCRFGSGCRFRHVEPPRADLVAYFVTAIELARDADGYASAEVPAASAVPDNVASRGGEASAEDSAAASSWQAIALSVPDALISAALASGVVGSASEAEIALQAAERQVSAGVCCGICFEPVLSAEAPERRFGLLTACAHAFCLDCIRGWRARLDLPPETVRSCPVCRRISFCVIPCARLLTDAARKAAANAAYAQSQAKIPCKYFDGGRGECQFGSSCRYAHTRPDGSAQVYVRPPLLTDGDGGVTVKRAARLNEFFA